jgi:hypothetical protein
MYIVSHNMNAEIVILGHQYSGTECGTPPFCAEADRTWSWYYLV